MCKGSSVTPRIIQQNFRGSVKAIQVVEAMELLQEQQLGHMLAVKPKLSSRPKVVFQKKSIDEIIFNEHFAEYGIDTTMYSLKFVETSL